MKSRNVIFPIILLIVVIFLMVYFLRSPSKYEHTFYPMGGVPFKVVAYDRSQADFTEDVRAVEVKVEELEKIFNSHRTTSEVSKLTGAEMDVWHNLSADMYRCLNKALSWYGKTAGAFDVTVAPVLKMWRDAEKRGAEPTAEESQRVLLSVGSSDIVLSDRLGVKFLKEGMEFDFGGVAKGYILDEAGVVLTKRGVKRFILSAGGDVLMSGEGMFNVGIQDPEGEMNKKLVAKLEASQGSVVTSGHYQRYYRVGDKQYSHIVDPKTARPVDNDLASVTIVGPISTDVDALATAVAVLGFEKSVDLLKGSNQFNAILVRKNSDGFEICYTKALEGRIEYFDEWQKVKKTSF